MAAVLYEWSENDMDENEEMEMIENNDLFEPAYTINAYVKQFGNRLFLTGFYKQNLTLPLFFMWK